SVAVTGGAQDDPLRVPVQHLVPQAHRVLVRDQGFDVGAPEHHGAGAGSGSAVDRPAVPVPPGARETSSDSTKLDSTPSATVLPIARSTGMLDSASRLNTSRVIRLHTITACRVRSWSSRESPACSKNSA